MLALDHVRILDLSHFEAGPSCTELLAFLGADVIKIEPPKSGEAARNFLTNEPGLDSHLFILLNANKRSVSLNLKTERGRDLFRSLVPHVDVVLENFSPNTMEGLGLGYDTLRQLNARLIYVRVEPAPPIPQAPSDASPHGLIGTPESPATCQSGQLLLVPMC